MQVTSRFHVSKEVHFLNWVYCMRVCVLYVDRFDFPAYLGCCAKLWVLQRFEALSADGSGLLLDRPGAIEQSSQKRGSQL